MSQKRKRELRSCAVYVHWPRFNTQHYTNSFIGYALKKHLSRCLNANYLHLNGPIYFGKEALSQWPEDVLLDILGILKKHAKSPGQQVSLEIDAKSIGRYDYRRLYAAGINRCNIIADCSTDTVIELMETRHQNLRAAASLGYMLAVELLYADQETVSVIMQNNRRFCITHMTIWPRAGAYSEFYNALTSRSFVAYERYHYGCSGHRSAYMEHMWSQKPIIGIGPGAESMMGNKRYKSAKSMRTYVQELSKPDQVDTIVLHEQQLLNEHIMLNVGRVQGVSWHRCAAVMSKAQLNVLYARVNYLKAKNVVWCTKKAFGVSVVSEPVYQAILENLIVDVI